MWTNQITNFLHAAIHVVELVENLGSQTLDQVELLVDNLLLHHSLYLLLNSDFDFSFLPRSFPRRFVPLDLFNIKVLSFHTKPCISVLANE